MSFALTRVALWLAQPSNLLLLALVIAAVLAWTRFRRAARVLLTVAVACAVLPLLLPVAGPLTAALERSYAAEPELPTTVTGIIVLGGGVDTASTERWGVPALTDGAERLTVAAELARAHPGAIVVLSGGSGKIRPDDLSESEVARMFLERAGVPRDRLIVEDGSRTTAENAARSFEVARPGDGEVWVLVTSATHMPRAVLEFESAGWTVVPYPVDFRSGPLRPWPNGVDAAAATWARIDHAVREHLALLAFRLAAFLRDIGSA